MQELKIGVICPKENRFININKCKRCKYFWKKSVGVTPETRDEEVIECKYRKGVKMGSKLYSFLKDNNIEVRTDGAENEIYAFIPLYWIEEFISACQNNEFIYRFEEPHQEVVLFEDCICIDLDDIICALEEDVEKYKKLAN